MAARPYIRRLLDLVEEYDGELEINCILGNWEVSLTINGEIYVSNENSVNKACKEVVERVA